MPDDESNPVDEEIVNLQMAILEDHLTRMRCRGLTFQSFFNWKQMSLGRFGA